MINTTFTGRVTLQNSSTYAGTKYVFYKTKGNKNSWRPTLGGVIQNPPINGGSMFQADLCEYRLDGKVFLFRSFLVNADAAIDATTIVITKDDFKHKPEVGNILMKAPSTLTGTGDSATVTAVVEGDGVWTLTLSAAIGVLTAGDILVEAASAGSGVQMLVTNPNSMLEVDENMPYRSTTGESDYDGAIYNITPIMHEIAYVARMQPLPACVLALNKSNIEGLFEI